MYKIATGKDLEEAKDYINNLNNYTYHLYYVQQGDVFMIMIWNRKKFL